jgi:hypothetical protein
MYMLIQCTKALLDKMEIGSGELRSSEGYEQLPRSLLAWHAHTVSMDRRKAVILMNNATRYPVVIYRPKPKDFARMKDLMREAIVAALRMEGVCETVIDRYMADAGEIEFSKTTNRSMVAKMNQAVDTVSLMQDYLDENRLIQRYTSIAAGRYLQAWPEEGHSYPISKMLDYLGNYCDSGADGVCRSVLDVELYQLKIRIQIRGFDIWRRVLVPSNFSFRHLHRAIQAVFDWQDYHLHLFEARKRRSRTKLIIMDDDPETLECFEYGSYDILQERFTALKDILPDHHEVIYEYDFGDSWRHSIVLEKTVRSDAFEATYLDGQGERPPEDVGGAGGYAEYVRIMADDSDPEHESMKMWAQWQTERERSPEEISHRLRFCTSEYGHLTL